MNAVRGLGFCAGILLVAACASSASVPQGAPERTLRVAWCDPGTLLPQSLTNACALDVLMELYDPLVEIDPESGELEMRAAERIESADLRTWTITLEPDRTFHDGAPATADAYVAAWNFGAHPDNGQTRADDFRIIEGYEELAHGAPTLRGLRALDARTIEVVLRTPSATFPRRLVNAPWLPHSPGSLADPQAFDQRPIGTGPFRADERGWEPGRGIRLVRWEEFPGPRPEAAAIEYVEHADNGTAYRELLAGTLDIVTDLSQPDAEDARTRAGDRLLEGPGALIVYLFFPMYRPPFDDVRVREAIARSVDAEAIVRSILQAENLRPDGWASPLSRERREGACGPCVADPAAAAALLDQGPQLPHPLRLHYPMIGVTQEDVAEAAGNQIRAALDAEYVLAGALPPELIERAGKRELDGPVILGYLGDGPAPGLREFLEPLFHSSGSANFSGYANPELDDLLAAADREADADARLALLREAEDLVFRDVPAVPLMMNVDRVVHSPRVRLPTDRPAGLRYRQVTFAP